VTLEIFIAAFLVLAIADWWMDMIQRTTELICRASGAPMRPVGELLNPTFVKFALPIMLAKWALVVFWALYSSVTAALIALAAAWVITIVSPVPFRFTLPLVLKQIARVRDMDTTMGDQLLQMFETWKTVGARH
jgi:hypothetical protein